MSQMYHDELPGVALHNVAETGTPTWASADDGHTLHRVPAHVRQRLNVDARERYRHPTGCEVRFVPSADSPVAVTLSAAESTEVWPFWGPFQAEDPLDVGPEPTTHTLSVPGRVAALREDVETGPFEPRVCRLRFDPWVPAAIHEVAGDCRPPRDDELPSTRHLAYGTSITEGAAASAGHLGYVPRLARHLGVDALNLGSSGSAFCERAIAKHIAGREDWDVATLALSVNMANRGFTVAQFRERATRLVEEVADATDGPVVAVTLFPYHADVVAGDDTERARAFRDALRETVEQSPRGNLSLAAGAEVMDASGLTTDLLHPGDAGHGAIARGLADVVGPLLA